MGMTQAHLAAAIGIKVGEYISLVEKGKRRIPLARIPMLADALGVKRTDLLKWAFSEEEPLVYRLLFPNDAPITAAEDAPEGARSAESNETLDKLNTLPAVLRNSFILMLDQAATVQKSVNS
jgi:transcriptional regulator with XRE-family HTH domain